MSVCPFANENSLFVYDRSKTRLTNNNKQETSTAAVANLFIRTSFEKRIVKIQANVRANIYKKMQIEQNARTVFSTFSSFGECSLTYCSGGA